MLRQPSLGTRTELHGLDSIALHTGHRKRRKQSGELSLEAMEDLE